MPLTPNPFERSLEYSRSSKEYVAKIGKTALWFSAIMVGSAYAVGGKAVDLVSDAAKAYLDHEYNDTQK